MEVTNLLEQPISSIEAGEGSPMMNFISHPSQNIPDIRELFLKSRLRGLLRSEPWY